MSQNFEEKLQRLETLSNTIKNSELDLEEAFSVFEEGIKLAKSLEKELDKMEGKVKILLNEPKTPSDKVELDLFSDFE